MTLPKLSKTRLADKAVKIIYNLISIGKFKPGEKLPGEIQLGEEMGIARTTVREALGQLIGLGLINRGENGMFVSQAPASYVQSRIAPLLLENWEIRKLFESRIIIEGELAVLASARVKKEDINYLKKINDQMLSEYNNGLNYWEKDVMFHDNLAKFADNEILNSMRNILWDMFKKYEKNVMELDSVKKATHKWHSDLIDAVEKQDAYRIRNVIRVSLEASEKGVSNIRIFKKIKAVNTDHEK